LCLHTTMFVFSKLAVLLKPNMLTVIQTQYGNILRLKPAGESPLLLPANEHKQFVVIDFEYASANTPGLEFANHFTEWCYNYHDSAANYVCNTANYPTPEEQRRFIRSYINHRPQFHPKASVTPSATPKSNPSLGPSSSISSFMLDSRTPSGFTGLDEGYKEEEERRERQVTEEVERLMRETRIWRVANSAQWVAWGIVQAKILDLDADTSDSTPSSLTPPATSAGGKLASDELGPEAEEARDAKEHDKRPQGLMAEALLSGEDISKEQAGELEEGEDDEFDYLGYAQERAMFFWGDVVGLGVVKREELPEELRERMKVVPY